MSKMLDLIFKMFYVLFLLGKRKRSSNFVVFDILVAPFISPQLYYIAE